MRELQPVVLLIVARAPSAGPAKTRLAAQTSAELAATVHAWLFETVLARTRDLPVTARVLAVTPDEAAITDTTATVLGQGEGDLGERLTRVIGEVYRRYRRPMLIIGSDSPDLPFATMQSGAAAVCAGAVALCPSRDGGYCLIGLPQPIPELFSGIAWGTERVAEQTHRAAVRAGVTVRELPEWADVDTLADLRRLTERLIAAPKLDPALVQLRAHLLSARLEQYGSEP